LPSAKKTEGFKYQNGKGIYMAQGQVIGVLGAVVAAGLGYYYFTKREEETVETLLWILSLRKPVAYTPNGAVAI
jgi:hypothetical protein